MGLAVVNSRLYAGPLHWSVVCGDSFVLFDPTVGGFDGSSYLKSVEWLDKEAKQWKLAGSMSYRRLGCGVGVVWTS